MAQLTNNFNGGTSGTQLTAGSGGNTGGTSGNFFNNVSVASGAVLQFNSLAAFSGSLGLRTAVRATAGNAYVQWNASFAAIPDSYDRFFLRISAVPAFTNGVIATWYEDALVNNMKLRLNTTGTLSILNGTTPVATSATALTPGQWYRIEVHAHASTTAAFMEVRIYADPASSSFTESFGSTTTFPGPGDIGAVLYGPQGVSANWPTSSDFVDFDEIVSGASTWVGPLGGASKPIVPAGISAAASVSGRTIQKRVIGVSVISAQSTVSGNLGTPPTSGGTAPGATFGVSTFGEATFGSPVTPPTGGGGGGTGGGGGGSSSVTPGQPTIVPPSTPTGDAIVDFIESSPPGMFPENDDSNFGFAIRGLWAAKVEDLIAQQDLIYKERFVDRSELFLDEWERETGTPAFPAGFDLTTRRAIVKGRLRKGPFTRAKRKEIIERYLKATFGGGVSFPPTGISIGSGIKLTGGSTAPDVTAVYKIVEDIPNYLYHVYILNTYTPAAGMQRELKRITPAGIEFDINFVASLP